MLNGSTRDSITVNFGASPFTNTVPSGFTAGLASGKWHLRQPEPTGAAHAPHAATGRVLG